MCPNEERPDGTDRHVQHERLHRLSHDLKNRIGGTLEVLRTLRDLPPGMDAGELHTHAERNLFLAMHQLESALDDLGLQRGPGTFTQAPCDLSAITKEAAGQAGARFARKEQVLDRDIAGPLPVLGDATALAEVVLALLSNASKFSARGAKVRLAAVRNGDRAVVTVMDAGIGLTAEDLARVFQRYAWLASRPTEGEGQARSALARAHQCATAHGGGLYASSDGPGQGCRFSLWLPLTLSSRE